MLENTIKIYICEICNTSYENKTHAEICETSGIPKNYDKFTGKFLLAPVQTMTHSDDLQSSSVSFKIKWSIVKIISNEIKPLTSTNVYNLIYGVHKIGHKISYKYFCVHPNSIVYNTLLDKSHIIPEEMYGYILNKHNQIQSERNNVSISEFNSIVVRHADELTTEIASKLNISIDNSEFDNYILEGLHNVSSENING